jgi:hypothetical protein
MLANRNGCGSRRGAAQLALAACVAVSLAGCTGEPSASPTSDPFAYAVSSMLIRAESGGASEAQLEILRQAQAAGVLEFEPYESTIDATFECFREQGIDYQSNGTSSSRGFPEIIYVVAGPEAGPLPEATACENEHSAFVAELYQVQPASAEASEKQFIAALPVLIPCLREAGLLPATGEPTVDEVHDAIWAGFDSIEDGSAPEGFHPTTCIDLAGITGGF